MNSYPGRLNHTVTQEMFDALLLWAVENNASDVVLNPEDPVWVQIHGKWETVNTLRLTDAETAALVCDFTGQSQAEVGRQIRTLNYAASATHSCFLILA